ncbi:MAG: DUF4465 domain-containing protein [Proteiniphilum sp.]|nr:DUF4465 domain-containing protein [Proteiniphilum sp.]
MKKNLFYLLFISALLLVSCENEEMTITKVMDLESKLTQPETEWTGDKSGTEITGDWGSIWKNQFSGSDNIFQFDNYFSDFAWGGFMYTNKSDITTASYTNNSAITGKAYSGKVYLTANNTESNPAVVSFKDGKTYRVKGMFITNSTYAYLSMKNGDQFAKKFSDGDWFKLDIYGEDVSGNESQPVSVYLADFRNGKKEILNTWKWVELSDLGELKSLHFNLTSTDNGDWGMNTPSYFSIDDLTILMDE